MLTASRLLPSILIIFLSACAKLILSLCLLLHPLLIQVLSALIVAFLPCQKVRRSRKRRRGREKGRANERIFTPVALCRWQEFREGRWSPISTHFSLISVDTGDARGKRERERETRKGRRKKVEEERKRETRRRGTGMPSYILMTQAATQSVPAPWHGVMTHTHTHKLFLPDTSTWCCLSVLTRTSIPCPHTRTLKHTHHSHARTWNIRQQIHSPLTSYNNEPDCKWCTFITGQQKPGASEAARGAWSGWAGVKLFSKAKFNELCRQMGFVIHLRGLNWGAASPCSPEISEVSVS